MLYLRDNCGYSVNFINTLKGMLRKNEHERFSIQRLISILSRVNFIDNRDSIGTLYVDNSFNNNTGSVNDFSSMNLDFDRQSAISHKQQRTYSQHFGQNLHSHHHPQSIGSPIRPPNPRTDILRRSGHLNNNNNHNRRMGSPLVNNFSVKSGGTRSHAGGMMNRGFRSPKSNLLGKVNFSKGTLSTVG